MKEPFKQTIIDPLCDIVAALEKNELFYFAFVTSLSIITSVIVVFIATAIR